MKTLTASHGVKFECLEKFLKKVGLFLHSQGFYQWVDAWAVTFFVFL